MKDLRVTISLKNNILVSKREEFGLNQKDFAKFLDINVQSYAAFECLQSHPNKSKSAYRDAEKMATTLEVNIEDLFPESLTKIKFNKRVVEFESSDLALLSCEPKQILQIEANELTQTVNRALKTLNPRQEFVLRKRFGLGGEEHTLREVGKAMGCNAERVRQIEAHGMRKLRHPSTLKKAK